MWFSKVTISLLMLLISCQITKAASYTFTTFNIPGLEEVFGINDKGQVVGWSIQGDAAYGFLYSNGSYTSIMGPDTHDYFTSRAFGINNSGEIAGYTVAGNGMTQGFVDNNGVFTRISYPGPTYTVVNGINNIGEVVGDYTSVSNGIPVYGYLRTAAGTFIPLDVPGGSNTAPNGINDQGQIVGTFDEGGIYGPGQSFLYDHGSFVTLPPVFDSCGGAFGINDIGQISGCTGILNPDGSFTSFSIPGYKGAIVEGINNLGQVTGETTNADGDYVGFIATPTTVPEPRSFLPIAIAFVIFRLTRTLRPCE